MNCHKKIGTNQLLHKISLSTRALYHLLLFFSLSPLFLLSSSMDETNREAETQDFMNVESFSQLPFIRSPNPKHKPIRVFGKDFSGTTSQEDYSNLFQTKNKEEEEEEEEEEEDQTGENSCDNNSIINNRRFECQYCFRNFPTSQALGGHQNAHKRERQLAKRGASSSSSSYFHHPDTSLYGYHNYPSWTNSPLTAVRSYGGHVSGSQTSAYYTRPSYGSPLGQWRVPRPSSSSLQRPHSTLSLLTSSQSQPPSQVGGSAAQNQTPPYRYDLSPNVQDQVSLDLHL